MAARSTQPRKFMRGLKTHRKMRERAILERLQARRPHDRRHGRADLSRHRPAAAWRGRPCRCWRIWRILSRAASSRPTAIRRSMRATDCVETRAETLLRRFVGLRRTARLGIGTSAGRPAAQAPASRRRPPRRARPGNRRCALHCRRDRGGRSARPSACRHRSMSPSSVMRIDTSTGNARMAVLGQRLDRSSSLVRRPPWAERSKVQPSVVRPALRRQSSTRSAGKIIAPPGDSADSRRSAAAPAPPRSAATGFMSPVRVCCRIERRRIVEIRRNVVKRRDRRRPRQAETSETATAPAAPRGRATVRSTPPRSPSSTAAKKRGAGEAAAPRAASSADKPSTQKKPIVSTKPKRWPRPAINEQHRREGRQPSATSRARDDRRSARIHHCCPAATQPTRCRDALRVFCSARSGNTRRHRQSVGRR